jgi:MFS superfamily sulfate permease-like transporter
MAGHVRFGARTGGALVILGALVLFVGLFLGDSVATLFRLLPRSLLGVILLFGGLELASGVEANNLQKEDRYVMLLTTGVSMWNMGVGYLTGLILWYAFQWKWLRA